MQFTALDWTLVAAYFVLTAGIGLFFTRRGGSSVSEYFVSGRKAPWWLLGTSMVATTFAADTPLAVTGLVASRGVAGNWLWWSALLGGTLTVFFFARLWHRAGVLTDVELAEVRYSGRPAAILRGARALYLGIPINLLILGWVTTAMVKVLSIALGIDPWIAIGICLVFTVLYATAAGLWAVLWTDFFQFGLMMLSATVLAFVAVDAAGGLDAAVQKASAAFGSTRALTSVLPVAVEGGAVVTYAWMPVTALAVYLAVQWWASWYPGAEPGGGGYVAQRIFAARSERDGVLATLLFQVAHYAVRPWPWIVTAIAALALYPGAEDKEALYVRAFVELLPTPWRGLMLAGFAAAYMSTISTQLNWGASYLVNDFYRRFVRPQASERHCVNASRAATVLLFVASIAVSRALDTVGGAWELLLSIGAGTGLVLILRWYWWRVNAWSEISAMIASLAASLAARQWLQPRFAPEDPNGTAAVLLFTVGATAAVSLVATLLTAPEPRPHLEAFYRLVRPGGWGWRHISEPLGFGREPAGGGARRPFASWLVSIAAVYAALFGTGKLIFGDLPLAGALLAVSAAGFVLLARWLR